MLGLNQLCGFWVGGTSSPAFVGSAFRNDSGSITYPAGTADGDFLVLHVTHSSGAVPTPSGWSLAAAVTWATLGYGSAIFTKTVSGESSVTFTGLNGGGMLVAYRGVSGTGAVGTYVNEASGATIPIPGITPQSESSLVLGFACDRDAVVPTPPAGWTSRISATTSFFFGWDTSEKAFGSTSPTGTQTWTQSNAAYQAVGVLIELKP